MDEEDAKASRKGEIAAVLSKERAGDDVDVIDEVPYVRKSAAAVIGRIRCYRVGRDPVDEAIRLHGRYCYAVKDDLTYPEIGKRTLAETVDAAERVEPQLRKGLMSNKLSDGVRIRVAVADVRVRVL